MRSSGRVLLIDDNDDHRQSLANALREVGWNVECARDGKSGLDAMARHQPQIVVTELMLPDVRGFHFGRSLRSMVDHDVIVIALTRLSRNLHGRALSAGFDSIETKPVDVEALHRCMVRLAQPLAM